MSRSAGSGLGPRLCRTVPRSYSWKALVQAYHCEVVRARVGQANSLLLRAYVALGAGIAIIFVVWLLVSLSLPGWLWIALLVGIGSVLALAWSSIRHRSATHRIYAPIRHRNAARYPIDRIIEIEAMNRRFLARHATEFRDAPSGLVVPVAYSAPGGTPAEQGSSSHRTGRAKQNRLRRHITQNKDLYEFAALLLPLVTAAGGAVVWIISNWLD